MQIVLHTITGNASTTFHNFTYTLEGDEIVVSAGSYFRDSQELISVPQETRFPRPTIQEWIQHEIWLTENGIQLYSSPEFFINPTNPIDRLAWMMIFSPVPAEDQLELHAVVFEEI